MSASRVVSPAAPVSGFEHKYVLGPEIGKGSYSVVREAKDRATGAVRAAKFVSLTKDSSADAAVVPSALTQHQEEAEILQSVRHENIVAVHDVFYTATHCIIVMDLLKGGELFHQASRTQLSEAVVAKYIRGVLSALSYLHERGIVHRDVKLENVMLSEGDSAPRLIDFGFATRIAGCKSLNACCGSPNYMSPEMLKSTRTQEQSHAALPTRHQKYGVEVDVWAVGVALYVLLVGKYPFYDEKRSHWHKSIVLAQYSYPSTAVISEDARDLVARLLERDPERRLTAQEALGHPWISRHCGRDEVACSSSTPIRKCKTPPDATVAVAAACTPPNRTTKQ